MSTDGNGGPKGETAPSGSLDATIIHADGSRTPVKQSFFSWLKGIFTNAKADS